MGDIQLQIYGYYRYFQLICIKNAKSGTFFSSYTPFFVFSLRFLGLILKISVSLAALKSNKTFKSLIMKKFIYGLAMTGLLCACGDDDHATASIDGYVSENVLGWEGKETYLQGVTVTLSGDGVRERSLKTDAYGRYAFSGLSTGAYRLNFTYDDYVTADTILHIYHEKKYEVPVTLLFDFNGATAEWVCDDLRLNLQENNFTFKQSGKILYSGRYEVNANGTILTFNSDKPVTAVFDADYIGQGALYVFTPDSINNSTRFRFYKQ